MNPAYAKNQEDLPALPSLPDAITGLDYLYAWRSTHYWRTKYQKKKRDGIFINSLSILFKQWSAKKTRLRGMNIIPGS
jgi:hypothetical protein